MNKDKNKNRKSNLYRIKAENNKATTLNIIHLYSSIGLIYTFIHRQYT